MPWQYIRIARFGGPEVLELAERPTIPHPGPGEVRIKVLAAGTGFTDTFIRRGRYPDFKGPQPFTPGYDVVGVVEETGLGVPAQLAGQLVLVPDVEGPELEPELEPGDSIQSLQPVSADDLRALAPRLEDMVYWKPDQN
jgi:NADPH:quinone reductase-like Zn-dependent oxidoreductase